jgi:hypothetical protein
MPPRLPSPLVRLPPRTERRLPSPLPEPKPELTARSKVSTIRVLPLPERPPLLLNKSPLLLNKSPLKPPPQKPLIREVTSPLNNPPLLKRREANEQVVEDIDSIYAYNNFTLYVLEVVFK